MPSTISRRQIEQWIVAIIHALIADNTVPVIEHAHLGNLGFRSPKKLEELLTAVEGKFEIEIPRRQEAKVRIVQQLQEAVVRALRKKGVRVED